MAKQNKKVRHGIRVSDIPPEIYEQIKDDAKHGLRKINKQVLHILILHYTKNV